MGSTKRAERERGTWGGGSISEREPGVFVIRLSHRRDPNTGKRTREYRTFRGTKRQAQRLLAEMMQTKATHGPTTATTAGHTLDGWVKQHLAIADLSERTRRDQRVLWGRYSTPVLRATKLRDVTTAALTAHMAVLRERTSAHTGRKLAPRTRQLYLNVIKAALASAVKQHVLPANPATGVEVKGGSGVSHASSALTPEEVRAFLDHDPDDRLHALWVASATTGARPGELLALRWDDVDFDAWTLTIARALTEGTEGPVFGPCKAGSARVLPVQAVPGLLLALQRHRKRQLEERLKLGERWVDERLVFTSEIGSALDRHNVSARFRRRCKAAGIRACRLYDLRHSLGSVLIANGVDAKTVSLLLGHRDVRTTLRHYTHPDREQQQRALGSVPWAGTASG